jgi:hypothetical protein
MEMNKLETPDKVESGLDRIVVPVSLDDMHKLEKVRLELHEIATHNPQVAQMITALTSKMWPIINRRRMVVCVPDMALGKAVRPFFTSGNNVHVERASIKRSQIEKYL